MGMIYLYDLGSRISQTAIPPPINEARIKAITRNLEELPEFAELFLTTSVCVDTTTAVNGNTICGVAGSTCNVGLLVESEAVVDVGKGGGVAPLSTSNSCPC